MKTSQFGAPKESISAAIFFIGLAAIFAFDWFWPGILVLIGVTSLAEVFLRRWEPDADDIPLKVEEPFGEKQEEIASLIYPSKCPSCGAAAPEPTADGENTQPATCSYCGARLQPIFTEARARQ